jgi:hypothetical protein
MDAYLIGILWSAQYLSALHFVAPNLAKKLLVVTMWFVVSIFLFTQVIGQDMQGILLESGVLVVQVGLIYAAKKYDFRFLALAFFLHGCWDFFHIFNQETIHKPVIYSQICVPYDWLVAIYIVWRKWEKVS